MGSETDYIELVREAQLGNEECLNRLAELVRGRLRVYVYRLTLSDDATSDIVQESILEMFRILGKLKEADRFWPWLYGIALNKVHRHHRSQQRHRTVSMSQAGEGEAKKDKEAGLEKLISQELKQLVSAAMRSLKPRYRAVLSMRCYDEMSYSEIAESMGCSEFATRMLFCRAKKSLEKELSRIGLGKGALLTALVLFGKMTAPSEAAAASVSVTAASVKAGAAASVVVMAASKTAVVSVAAAGVLAVGTVVSTSGPDKTMAGAGQKPTDILQPGSVAAQVTGQSEQWWYYYPSEVDGPVMMRLVKADSDGKERYCERVQNERGNYRFDENTNTVYVENHRMWRSDLGVQRLPTDRPQLRGFLNSIEGGSEPMEYLSGRGKGLLVIVRRDKEGNNARIMRHYNVLDEEYFRYDWPAGAKVVDKRDVMHERGWTYFKVSGKIDGETVRGTGRIPFVYAASRRYWPWMKLEAGAKKIIDKGFGGFGRPWMGLHTIDNVRRDAAKEKIAFETRLLPGGENAEVILNKEEERIIYTIDMKADLIEKIKFTGRTQGELRFSYLEEVDNVGREFAQPRRSGYRTAQQKSTGILGFLEAITEK